MAFLVGQPTMEHSVSFPRVSALSIARWIRAVLSFALLTGSISGCGTIPDASDLIHTKLLHLAYPRFVGPDGSLTRKQGQSIIARFRRHQEQPTDILGRHLGFEKAISDVPLVVGNKVTLLKNAGQ